MSTVQAEIRVFTGNVHYNRTGSHHQHPTNSSSQDKVCRGMPQDVLLDQQPKRILPITLHRPPKLRFYAMSPPSQVPKAEEHRKKLRYLQRFHNELIDPDCPLKFGKGLDREHLTAVILQDPKVLETAQRVAPLVDAAGGKLKDDEKYPPAWITTKGSFTATWRFLKTWAAELDGIKSSRHPALAVRKQRAEDGQVIEARGYLFGPPPEPKPQATQSAITRPTPEIAPFGEQGVLFGEQTSGGSSSLEDTFQFRGEQHDTTTALPSTRGGLEQQEEPEPTAQTLENEQEDFNKIEDWFKWWAERHNDRVQKEREDKGIHGD